MGALISRDSSLQLTVSSIPPAPSSSVLLSSLPSAVVRDAFDALWTALELQHTTRTDRPSFNHFRRGLQAALMAEWGELGVTTRRAVWEEWRETLALVVEGGLCEAGELDAFYRLFLPCTYRITSRSITTAQQLLKHIDLAVSASRCEARAENQAKSWTVRTAGMLRAEWETIHGTCKEGIVTELESVVRELKEDTKVVFCPVYSPWPHLEQIFTAYNDAKLEPAAINDLATCLDSLVFLSPRIPKHRFTPSPSSIDSSPLLEYPFPSPEESVPRPQLQREVRRVTMKRQRTVSPSRV